jgi:phosphoribosylformimino-5-aminoimidazole carboxamide ribotide isomerase
MALILFPAIDLFGGKVVRLTQGDFSRRSDYDVKPIDVAVKYLKAGCDHIHIVDLEGAKEGHPCNLDALSEIAALGMFVQYGGGLRSNSSIREALNAGADRVMVGSLLFTDKAAPGKLFSEFGTAVMPSVDIKNGKVVFNGWLSGTDTTPADAIKELHKIGYNVFLVTDTERDGSMTGTRTGLYKPLIGADYDIVAAGGITTAEDISRLAEAGVGAAVVGKSLYEGGITLSDALNAAKGGIK